MTPDEKSRLSVMRKAGQSYAEIADALGLSKNTVKTFCRRNGLTVEVKDAPVTEMPVLSESRLCPNCGKPVIQIQGRKEKKFCSDVCRTHWWNSHLSLVNRKAVYTVSAALSNILILFVYGNNAFHDVRYMYS